MLGDKLKKLKGNKGEWSEIFTFLNVLGKGRIYGADGDVELIEDMVLDVDKIIRKEEEETVEYLIDGLAGTVKILENDKIIATVTQEEIIEQSEIVFDAISESRGAFSIPPVEEFMERIACRKIKASSKEKTDITMELYDPRAGFSFKQGFSIKSMLGNPSTLLNASRSTNFIFKLTGDLNPEMITDVNTREGRYTFLEKFKPLIENSIGIEFFSMESETFYDNLELIDSSLPIIVSEMLKLHYFRGVSDINEQVEIIAKENPLNYRNKKLPHYEYKIKKFLVACALGMVPSTPWKGQEDASGGFLIVREDGAVACYHIYNRNEFEDYLIENTKLETPSTSRHKFSFIEDTVDKEHVLRLNLQIRFK